MPTGIYEHKRGKEHYMFGRKQSLETKEKHRVYMLAHPIKYWLGKSKPLSEETKKKISLSNTGKKASDETKLKMSKFRLNNPIRYWFGKKRLDITGEKCHFWNGGSSYEEYGKEFNQELKDRIREKYNYICQIPECSKKENGKNHIVHHIDYDKKNNTENNLILLCNSCHAKTNFTREDWKQYFNNNAGD